MVGSPPPHGRDLDLLVRPAVEHALTSALSEQGLVRSGATWAVFRRCTAEVVELIRPATWRLIPALVDLLYADARPIPGFARLVRPSPSHELLLLARQLVAGDGQLTEKRRRRIEAAVGDDPEAWRRARDAAPSWGLASALACLWSSYTTGRRTATHARVRAHREWLVATGLPRSLATAKVWIGVAPRRRRGAVVTFSGIDGSGKSLQANALQQALGQLGYEAAIEWTRLGSRLSNPSLDLLAWPGYKALELARRVRVRKRPAGEGIPDESRTPGEIVLGRSVVLLYAWTAVTALVNALSQRQATRRQTRNGKIAICDRYTLDSIVQLRYRYGFSRRFRLHFWLIRILSPRPLRSYFLDVSPETALSRKEMEFGLEELACFAELYADEYPASGVRRIDGERAAEQLCAEIARDVWLALSRR